MAVGRPGVAGGPSSPWWSSRGDVAALLRDRRRDRRRRGSVRAAAGQAARSALGVLAHPGQAIAALDLLAAELRAGILPASRPSWRWPTMLRSLRPAAAAAAHGGDVVAALRAASDGARRGSAGRSRRRVARRRARRCPARARARPGGHGRARRCGGRPRGPGRGRARTGHRTADGRPPGARTVARRRHGGRPGARPHRHRRRARPAWPGASRWPARASSGSIGSWPRSMPRDARRRGCRSVGVVRDPAAGGSALPGPLRRATRCPIVRPGARRHRAGAAGRRGRAWSGDGIAGGPRGHSGRPQRRWAAWRRRHRGAGPRRLADQLPTALDLMVATLDAGRPPAAAFALVAEVTPAPLGDELALVGASLAVGGDPQAVWRTWASDPVVGTARPGVPSRRDVGHAGGAGGGLGGRRAAPRAPGRPP